MSAELFVGGVDDERGPHRRCTGHVTGSLTDFVPCPLRATRVTWSKYGGSFACDDPGHIGLATSIEPIDKFFADLHMSVIAHEAECALAACVVPE